MGIVSGYVTVLCFVLLLAKLLTRLLKKRKADHVLMKLHKYLSAGMLFMGILHLILVYPVLRGRSKVVVVSGIVAMILMVLIIALCHMIKDRKKRVWLHRMLSLVLTLFVVVHIVWYLVDLNAYQQNIKSIATSADSVQRVSYRRFLQIRH